MLLSVHLYPYEDKTVLVPAAAAVAAPAAPAPAAAAAAAEAGGACIGTAACGGDNVAPAVFLLKAAATASSIPV